jgi:hypothetical protein
VNVQAPGGCLWSASSSASWITVVEGAQGNGNGRVLFRAAANTGTTARSGSLQVAGERVDVRQLPAGATPTPPPPAPGDCSFALVPDSAVTGPEPSSGSIAVQTGNDCSWTAVSDAAWLTVVAGATGSGSGQVNYQAAANTSSSGRTGRITVGTATFTLQQAGVASCNYRIDPRSASLSADGGTGAVDVETGSLCVWSASTSASWIAITSGTSGIGNGRVEYRVDPNGSTSARTGVIDVAGNQFTIDQEGAAAPPPTEPVTVTGNIRNLEGSCPERRFRVDGRDVRTTSETDYDGGSCADLRQNEFVTVTGLVGQDGVLVADEVAF